MEELKPKYDLEKVKNICEQCLESTDTERFINFIAPSRSLQCVVEVVGCKPSEASAICIKGILQLNSNDFSHHVLQWGDVSDVYGLQNYLNNDWYIKFTLYQEDDRFKLEEISFHRPEHDLKLVDGRILLGTEGGNT
jgi:hypothetical protein